MILLVLRRVDSGQDTIWLSCHPFVEYDFHVFSFVFCFVCSSLSISWLLVTGMTFLRESLLLPCATFVWNLDGRSGHDIHLYILCFSRILFCVFRVHFLCYWIDFRLAFSFVATSQKLDFKINNKSQPEFPRLFIRRFFLLRVLFVLKPILKVFLIGASHSVFVRKLSKSHDGVHTINFRSDLSYGFMQIVVAKMCDNWNEFGQNR